MKDNGKYIFLLIGPFLYYLLHEVVYGLLGFRFFWDATVTQFCIAYALFLCVYTIHIPIRKWLDDYISWNENPTKRLGLQTAFFTLFTSFIVSCLHALGSYFFILLSDEFFVSLQSLVIDGVMMAFVIQLFVLLEFGQYLLQKWNSARIEMATFQKEKAQFNLELLRTQINPHFLFNNLNTLSSLIYINQDKAADFLRKLSGVYRSILEYRNKEVITLEEELSFFIQYKDLLEIRFEKMLFFKLNIQDAVKQKKIIPLTLQMLVENAIKHNALSQNKPLTISLETKDDYILVENNIQPKEVLEYSSGLGLKMIENRFAYLTKEPVVIDKTLGHFAIKIPLIQA